MLFGQWLNRHRIFKRLVKVLIRLRICAGWSEPLLVAHTGTALLEISCRGSIILLDIAGIATSNVYEPHIISSRLRKKYLEIYTNKYCVHACVFLKSQAVNKYQRACYYMASCV